MKFKSIKLISSVFISAILLSSCGVSSHYYTVTFDSHGGSNVPSQKVVYGDKVERPDDPTRLGYNFVNWTYQNEEWSFIGYSVTQDMTLDANWSIITYNVIYNLDGGTNDSNNPSTYTVEDNITLAAPTKTGYTFFGWFDNNGNQVTSIVAGTTGALTLTARWNEGNEYTATLDANGGSVSETLINVQYEHSYSLPTPTRLGYTFDGWYDGSTKVNNTGIWKYTSNKTFVAHWTIINYSINYTLNGGTNNPSNPSTYTVEDSITFAAPTKTGYTFLGWYSNDTLLTDISSGSTGELNIEARWSANLNFLSVTSEDTSKGTVAITSGSGYSGESITVVATPVDDCVFNGWYHESAKVSNDTTYTFIMPTSDYSLVAQFLTEEEEMRCLGIIPTLSEDGKTITYGLYPQTNVNDSTLISSLDSLTIPETNGWYLYNGDYYAKINATPDSPYCTFDNGTTIESGAKYWFKCEPIVWNILSNTSGEYYIVSSVLLDVHCYYNSDSNRIIDGQTIYPNNYKYSDIRTWLNEDFYNSAFALGNEYIQTTTVDNSASTTNSASNKYACENTEDKVFLPSYRDYRNSSYGFFESSSDTVTRVCKTTDWARARGANCSTSSLSLYNGYYWTRSPNTSSPCYVWYISYFGELIRTGIVIYIDVNVRPAIMLKIA